MITLPLAALVAVNAVPLFGVVFLGWEAIPLLVLYWAESAAVGFYNILKMLRIGGVIAIPACVFFAIHFGMFMMGHLVFLGVFAGLAQGNMDDPLTGFRLLVLHDWELKLAAASFFVSHGVSFGVNFLGKREYEGRTIQKQMMEPYGRIVVMHVAIILGGFALLSLKAGAAVLAILVTLKTGLDIQLHRKQHEKAAGAMKD